MEYVMKKIIEKLKLIRRKIKEFNNRLGSKKRNKKLKQKDFTIISNNCFAGLTYEYLGLPFTSPTIGLYFFAKDYIKFIKKLKYYTSIPLEELNVDKSKYKDELLRIGQNSVILGKIDDVEIVFLHYNSFSEAKEKWEKRCKRINYDKLIIKFNDQNLCSEDELKEFNSLNFDNKICFTVKKYDFNGFIQMKKYKNKDYVGDDSFSYHDEFDIIDYINNELI